MHQEDKKVDDDTTKFYIAEMTFTNYVCQEMNEEYNLPTVKIVEYVNTWTRGLH